MTPLQPMYNLLEALNLPQILKTMFVRKAICGQLDGDFNDLDMETMLLQALAISRGLEFLSYDNLSDGVEAILQVYEEFHLGNHIATLDHQLPGNVSPIEQFQHTFTVKDFLAEIGMI
jgi:hypothetical protein